MREREKYSPHLHRICNLKMKTGKSGEALKDKPFWIDEPKLQSRYWFIYPTDSFRMNINWIYENRILTTMI